MPTSPHLKYKVQIVDNSADTQLFHRCMQGSPAWIPTTSLQARVSASCRSLEYALAPAPSEPPRYPIPHQLLDQPSHLLFLQTKPAPRRFPTHTTLSPGYGLFPSASSPGAGERDQDPLELGREDQNPLELGRGEPGSPGAG